MTSEIDLESARVDAVFLATTTGQICTNPQNLARAFLLLDSSLKEKDAALTQAYTALAKSREALINADTELAKRG